VDAASIVIFARNAGEPGSVFSGIYLESWHEPAEASGQWAASQLGLVGLTGGLTTDQVEKQWTPEYRRFRECWSCLRSLARPVWSDPSVERDDAGVIFSRD
jgi:hypothetical protein